MCLVLLEVIELVLGFLGSIFLLRELMRLRLKDGHIEVDTKIESYNNRLCIRRVGIVLLAMSFITQIVTVTPEIIHL